MGYVERTLDSGLVLQEYGQDHASIERELKRRDSLLSLQGWPSETHRCIIWKVVRYAGPDRPYETVLVWMSQRGEPYPLSSGILDALDHLDKNKRVAYKSEDVLNVERERERDRRIANENERLTEDYLFLHGHPITPRGQWLRMHRDKHRARGKKL